MLTKQRIREWIDHYNGNVYVSFSGGKDSTVLLDIARKIKTDIPGLFCDTGLELPELRQFVRSFENIDMMRPKKTFLQIINEDGYPIPSKEASACIRGARRCLAAMTKDSNMDGSSDGYPYAQLYRKLCGIGEYTRPDKQPRGTGGSEKWVFAQDKWKFMLYAPFNVTYRCCDIMKKNISHRYAHKTGRYSMTAQTAFESRLRTQNWLKHGCNGFDMKEPVSNPMAFWTDQDVLLYIALNDIKLASPYGSIVVDDGDRVGSFKREEWPDACKVELTSDKRPRLKTTGFNRTGCYACGFGIHLETPEESRIQSIIDYSNPKFADYMLRGGHFDEETGLWKPHYGLGYWFVFEWMNIHGGLHIYYPNREHYLQTYMTDETRYYLYETGGVY